MVGELYGFEEVIDDSIITIAGKDPFNHGDISSIIFLIDVYMTEMPILTTLYKSALLHGCFGYTPHFNLYNSITESQIFTFINIY